MPPQAIIPTTALLNAGLLFLQLNHGLPRHLSSDCLVLFFEAGYSFSTCSLLIVEARSLTLSFL